MTAADNMTTETVAHATSRRAQRRRLRGRELKGAHWVFDGTTRETGKDVVWVVQRDAETGVRRYVSTSRSGRAVVRYSLR